MTPPRVAAIALLSYALLRSLRFICVPKNPLLMVSRDILWKGITEDLVEDLLRFFFAPYISQMDLSRSIEPMDKELEQLHAHSDASARRADKLFRIWLKNGQELCFFVHVEVQGYRDEDFPLRMFESSYRIKDRFQCPVAALVIYTDPRHRHQVSEYEDVFMGTQTIYRFNAYVLAEHPPEELAKEENIFATVLEAAWTGLMANTDERRIAEMQLSIARRLLERGYDKEKARHVLNFIRYFVRFKNQENAIEFEAQFDQITKASVPMGIEQAIMEELKRQSYAEGRGQGIEQGIELERQKARQEKLEAARKMLTSGLTAAQIAEFLNLPLEAVESLARE
jgi:predicted transposase/invertase (TIGR01784 family)